jgi:hypothetical protein
MPGKRRAKRKGRITYKRPKKAIANKEPPPPSIDIDNFISNNQPSRSPVNLNLDTSDTSSTDDKKTTMK